MKTNRKTVAGHERRGLADSRGAKQKELQHPGNGFGPKLKSRLVGFSFRNAAAAQVIVDNVWQYVHIGAAAFLFYEDHLLCLYSLLGFASLCGASAKSPCIFLGIVFVVQVEWLRHRAQAE